MHKTVIALRGTTGVGKTGTVRAMQSGHEHLIAVDLLREAMAAGFGFVEVGEMTRPIKGGHSVWPTVARVLEDHDFAVVEPCIAYAKLVAECPADVRLVNAYMVAAPWMTAARRRTRYIAEGRATPANVVNHWAYTRWAFDHCNREELLDRVADPGDLLLIDTMDYPIREVTFDEALAMVEAGWQKPEFSEDFHPQYQQVLQVSAYRYGSGDPRRKLFERGRLDAVLPERMDGMTVLDVGAMEGAFCFEALNRGASFCMALDVLDEPAALLRHVRSAQWQPITTAKVDVNTQAIPTLNELYEGSNYSLGLLLNVLHRVEDPGAVLEKVLAVCDAVVIENPFMMGTEPGRPGDTLSPGTWHLPPAWVKRVAEAQGFVLEGMSLGPYRPEQRLIWKLKRGEEA